MKKFIVLLIIIGMIAGGYLVYNNYFSLEARVFSEAKEAIEAGTHSPAKTEFYKEGFEEREETAKLNGSFDSENVYGATVRSDFEIIVDKETMLTKKLTIDGEVVYDDEENGLDF